MKTVNPANGKLLKTYEIMGKDEVAQIIGLASKAQEKWQDEDFKTRAKLLKNAATLLRENKDKYAKLITNEMGKPISESRGEIEKCAWVCEYYAKNGADFLKDEHIKTDASQSYIRFEPLGIILAVMPWNFPFWQVFRFAAPTLMAGNGGLLKHAANVTGCALAIEGIFKKAGFPKNLFRSLLVSHDMVEDIIANPALSAVTLTGSVRAGSAVASLAGKYIKKSVLELGGSDPYIVIKDADLELAATKCVQSRMINGGQSCIAAKRFLVESAIYDKFCEKVVEKMREYEPSNPLNDGCNLGPMTSKDHRKNLDKQVKESIEKGAKCLLGGKITKDEGAYYPPTVITDIAEDSPAYAEELFGPVACIFKVRNKEEAIKIANDSCFGLAAAVFSKNRNTAIAVANQLKTGNIAINDFVKSDPRLPFGGIKQSGYGRELSAYGMKEFVNIKTIVCS